MTTLRGLTFTVQNMIRRFAIEHDKLHNWEGCSPDLVKVWVSTNNCYSTLDPVEVRHFELIMETNIGAKFVINLGVDCVRHDF